MNSLKINTHELGRMNAYIQKNKLKKEKVKGEHELLRIKDGEIQIIVYKSGSVVYNDSNASKELIDAILKKEENYDFFLGSDETGKGEWYGPLVVLATALKPEQILELRKLGVKDSKTIKKLKLLQLAKEIIKMNFERHTIIIKPESYNKIYSDFSNEGKSLNDMMAWAHSRVIQELLTKIEFKKAKVVIDKFDYEKTEYRLEKIDKTDLKIIQKSKGESEIPVATASIIAKYIFELEVDKLDKKYGINLRKSNPDQLKPEILSKVAKTHFKNVKNYTI